MINTRRLDTSTYFLPSRTLGKEIAKIKMVSSRPSCICIDLIVVGLIVPGATLAEIELKDLAGLWLSDEGNSKMVKDSSGDENDGKLDTRLLFGLVGGAENHVDGLDEVFTSNKG